MTAAIAFQSARPTRTLESLDENLKEVAWLAGSWAGTDGGARVEEHWTHADGGTMLGVNRTVAGGRTVMFEFLRIGRSSEGIIYYASPKGRNPPTPFKLVESGPNRVVFENPEHDFPSRIIYELGEAGRLMGRVEGTQNGQTAGHTWYWERARLRN